MNVTTPGIEDTRAIRARSFALFFRILGIGVVAQVVDSLIVAVLAVPGGIARQVVSTVVFGGVMAPLLYYWVVRDIGRRITAEQHTHVQLTAAAREQARTAQAGQEQLALQAYVESMVASVPSALLLVSTDLIVRSVSQSFKELFGLGDLDVVGQPVEKVLPFSGVWRLVAEVLGSDDPRCKVSTEVSDQGRDREYHVTLAKLPQPDSDARLLLVVEDITERKRLLEQVEASRARFWGIVDAASDAILSVDEHQRIVIFNQQAEEMFGYQAREVIGQSLELLLPPQFRHGHHTFVQGFEREGPARRAMSQRPVLLGLRKSGEEFPLEITISKLMSEGKLLMTAIVRDISERQRMERELRKSQDALQTFLDNASDLVQTVAANGRFVYLNKACAHTIGYTPEEVAGLTVFDLIHPERREEYRNLFQRVMAGESITNVETTLLAKDGRSIPVEGHLSPGTRDEGRMAWAIFRDMTERKLAEARLTHLAHHDTLTGLPNRLLFLDRLGHEVAQARRAKQMVGLLFIDLDGFKPVNDRLGHDVGDLLLKAVAQRLVSGVRASDTISRWGGDEFTIILHDLNRVEGAAVVAKKILDSLANPFVLEGHEVSVTASIGIAIYPFDGESIDWLLKKADAAMYRAKSQTNSYEFFAPQVQQQVVSGLAFAQDLHRAVEQGALVVRYQPYVALPTRRLVGAQASVHWDRHDVVVTHTDLLQMAHEAGLLGQITQWMVHTACTEAHAWQRPGMPPIRVAVHLSRREFVQSHIVDSVARALRESGLDPRCLDLDLEEGIFLLESHRTAETLGALRRLGLTLIVSDFGTGYAPLGDLKQLSIGGLRIGADLVSHLTTDVDRTAIVRGIIAMAHELELSVTAEGVVSETQVGWLQAHHCDMIQGGVVAGALAADAFRLLTAAGGGGPEWAAA